MAVVAAGASGAAHIADQLALLDRLTRVHRQRQTVRIHRGVAAAVADDDGVAITRTGTGLVVAGLGHGAARRCVDGRTGSRTDIHTLVVAAVPA